ncbi:uncharacterized protein LOC142525921 [Primulina tabacum]|uniref:uncharacterized protein LOC142525921 n=1 Tax=Primulina tabacum TaxID=48773 RepID=UPI003F598D69
MIQLHVEFGRLPSEDPNARLEQFLSICDIIKFNGVSNDAIRLRLFLFSLQGEAMKWLRYLPLDSITTWDGLVEVFLNRHGFSTGQHVETFYYGVDQSVRSMLDAASNGSLYRKTPVAALEIISNIAERNVGWQDNKSEKKVGFLDMDAIIAITTKLDGLTHHMAHLQANQTLALKQQKSTQLPVKPSKNTGPSMPPGFIQSKSKSNLEDILEKYIAGNEMRWQNHDAMMQRVETQLGQLANQFVTRDPGSLPSDKEKNPKGVNAIIVATQLKKEDIDVEGADKEKVSSKKRGENAREKETLAQMPSYAKFFKEVLSNKRKLVEFEMAKFSNECYAILQNKLPLKLKDPADSSIKYPRGVVEDVLVKVDKFIFPVDFVVLDMEEDREIALILGTPF